VRALIELLRGIKREQEITNQMLSALIGYEAAKTPSATPLIVEEIKFYAVGNEAAVEGWLPLRRDVVDDHGTTQDIY